MDSHLEATLNIEVRAEPVGGARLVGDYVRWEEEIRPFFSGSPSDPASYRRKWDEVQRRFGREERKAAASTLRPTSDRAARRLAEFVEKGGAVVTTGQQTGLLTGPLYTIHKALSAVVLAESLEALLGVVVLPVFWCASEDHDWLEVNHVHVASGRPDLRRIELASDEARPLPMSRRRLGVHIERFLDEVAHAVGEQEHSHAVLNQIRDAHRPEVTVAGAFRDLLERWLAPFDVLTTDAADGALKRLSAPLLGEALDEAAAHGTLLAETTARLAAAGYPAQVAVLPGATNLFLIDEEGRERLDRSAEGFLTHDTGRAFSGKQLHGLLAAGPESLSPNVLLRPVVESAVLPSLAYVAGPGEIGYFAQIGGLFAAYGMTAPVVYPRASVLLLEAGASRSLDVLGLSLEDLSLPRHELVTRLARRELPAGVGDALEALRRSTAEGYRRLMEEAAGLEPTLAGPLGGLRNEALAGLGRGERRILLEIKRRGSERADRLDRARAHLRPRGEPQERVLNVVEFLARHGPGLLPAIKRGIEEVSPLPPARSAVAVPE